MLSMRHINELWMDYIIKLKSVIPNTKPTNNLKEEKLF